MAILAEDYQRAWNLATQIMEKTAELNSILGIIVASKVHFKVDPITITTILNSLKADYLTLKAELLALAGQLP